MSGRDIFGKTVFRLSCISLTLFGVCILNTSAGEVIIKSGTCQELYEISAEVGSAGWSSVNTGSTCSYCNSRDTKKSWLVIKPTRSLKSGQKANVKIVAQTSECTSCKNFNLKLYVHYGSLKADTKEQLVAQLNNLTLLIGTFKNDKIEVSETYYMQYVSMFGRSRLVFVAEGGCFVLFSIQISTFFCEKDIVNGVSLSRLDSLANKSQRVNYSCPASSRASHNEVFGICMSNGTWQVKGSCLCLEGSYLKGDDGCQGCPNSTYKDYIGNDDCKSCPPNSQSAEGQVKCECKDDHFYRFSGDDHTNACHGIPSHVRKVEFFKKAASSVAVKWLPPLIEFGPDTFYEVECFKCKRDVCKIECTANTIFIPSKDNLNDPTVTVKNLESDTEYAFVIYSKNVNSLRINQSKWSYSETRKTYTKVSSQEKDESETPDYITTVVPIVVGVVSLLLGCLICTLWGRRKKPENAETTFPIELENILDQTECQDYAEVGPPTAIDMSCILSVFKDVKRSDNIFWEFPKNRLALLRKLGEGNFGTITKAKVSPMHAMGIEKGQIVAVKMLKENASLKDQRDFMGELELMKKLEPHPHLVQLLGCCTVSEPFFLILEYLVGGDLLGFLRKSRGHKDPYNTGEYVPTSRLSEKDLLSFAWMVSDGMDYLSSNGIVHRDLAARNVLVGEENICKVSDFGLAREGSYERKSKARLPAKWMAPEDLLHGQCTSMSDIWSYGILLWEIFTIGDSPYPGFKGRDIFRLIESGYRMNKPPHFSDKLYSLMMDCWKDEAIKRPKFSHISSFFQDFTSKVYLDLTKFDEEDYVNFDVI